MTKTITLQEITKDNWRQACKLKLKDGQEHFVAPNWYSIIEGILDGFTTRAIYEGETMVGFLMYGYDADENQYWIIRLMVDREHQGKGYGRAAMHAAMDALKVLPGCDAIHISFEPENVVARKLYASLGFEDTGRIEHGETVYCLKIVD